MVPVWVAPVAAVTLLCVAAPLLALAGRTDAATLVAAVTSPAARQALTLSLGTALTATAISCLLGFPLALALARWPTRLAALLRPFVLLPLVLPPLVSGLALLFLLGRRGPVGRWLAEAGITLPFTTTAVVIAQVFVAMPFLVVSVEGALRSKGDGHEAVAATLGARPTRIVATVTVPLVAPALRSGLLLCFARALGEFGATAMFAGNAPGTTRTMPLAIYTAFNGAGVDKDAAVALALELVVVAVLVMVASAVRSKR
ncbi:MAG: ABC transporter permease [Micrococcales bacterium]|nr:ABC transporter permease [Micrococcales bacterium]